MTRLVADPIARVLGGLALLVAVVALVVAARADSGSGSQVDRLSHCRSAWGVRVVQVYNMRVLAPFPTDSAGSNTYLVTVDPACVKAVTGSVPRGASGGFGTP